MSTDLLSEFFRWRQSRPVMPTREPDAVLVETNTAGTRTESHYRKGETAPYLVLTQFPAGENWMPRFTDEQLADLKRDNDENFRKGLFIDL